MRALVCAIAVVAAGCSSVLGIEDLQGPADGGPDGRAPGDDGGDPTGDGGVPQTIRFGGSLGVNHEGAQMPLANTGVELHNRATQEVFSGMTDATGTFSFVIPTGGGAVDGYIRIDTRADLDLPVTTVYVNPTVTDVDLRVLAFTNQEIADLATQVGEIRAPNTAFVLMQIFDATGNPVANEQFVPNPSAEVIYFDDFGAPNPNRMETSALGIAAILNETAGVPLTVNAGGPVVASRTTDPLEVDTANVLLMNAASSP